MHAVSRKGSFFKKMEGQQHVLLHSGGRENLVALLCKYLEMACNIFFK